MLLPLPLLALLGLTALHTVNGYWGSPPTAPPTPATQREPRHDYKFTFKSPLYLYNDNSTIPYFKTAGEATKEPAGVRLTSSEANRRGAIVSTRPLPFREWVAEFSFTVSPGRDSPGGNGLGLAFWYSRESPLALGSFFGGSDSWDGLAIVFDSVSKGTPVVYGLLNDRSVSAAVSDPKTLAHAFGTCHRDFRSAQTTNDVPVYARVTHENGELTLAMDLRQGGKVYTDCFSVKCRQVFICRVIIHQRLSHLHIPNRLPDNYYFGFTAATGPTPGDNHDIHSFEVWELNPPARPSSASLPSEPATKDFKIDESIKTHIDRAEHLRDQVRHDASPSTADHPSSAAADDRLSPISFKAFQDSQLKILDSLNTLKSTISSIRPSPPPPTDGSAPAPPAASAELDAINEKITQVNKALEALQDELRSSTQLLQGKIMHVYDIVENMERSSTGTLGHLTQKIEKINERLTFDLSLPTLLTLPLSAQQTATAATSKSASELHEKFVDSTQSSGVGLWVYIVVILVVQFAFILFLRSKKEERSKKFI